VSDDIRFDERGLAPAVVQHAVDGRILMLAWMNAEALAATRATGQVHFWSRSRAALWKKGETSGHTLELVELRWDCDADAIWVAARPAGPTCHTGAQSCFYAPGGDDGPPGTILDRLWSILIARRDGATADKSYVRSLIERGPDAIAAKIAEEQAELCAELADGAETALVHEAADLLFHVMVGLVSRDVPIGRVLAELDRRFGVSGHDEKNSR